MVFSEYCDFCEQNWPNWSSLAGKVDRARVNPVLVDISGTVTEGFLVVHKVDDVPLVQHVSSGFIATYGIRFVPETILVGPEGHVIKVWPGVLRPKDEEDILLTCEGHNEKGRKA